MTEETGGGQDNRDWDDRHQTGGDQDRVGHDEDGMDGDRDSGHWAAVVDSSSDAPGGSGDSSGASSASGSSGSSSGSGSSDSSRGAGSSGPSRRSGSPGTSRPSQSGRQSRQRQRAPGGDLLSDFQRWLIRSSAKNVRREISGQVRRTLGSGRSEPGDVWDTATTEVPPDAGESPECQWCPICRAARAMRESSPGLSSQVSAAGDVAASAIREALKAFDSVLARSEPADSRKPESYHPTEGSEDWSAARDSWAAEHGGLVDEPFPRVDVLGFTEPEGGVTDSETSDSETSDSETSDSETPAQGVTNEPDGSDEPDDRG